MDKNYETPEVRDFGAVQELTQQHFNKIGSTPDAVSSVDPNIVGSYTPVP